jgi:hypothetical protein
MLWPIDIKYPTRSVAKQFALTFQMKFKPQILCAAFYASLLAPIAYADPIPKDKVASGKIDDTVCGIKVTDGNLKATEAKLGKGKFVGKDELTKAYRWTKDGLQIEIFYSKDDGSIKRVELKGSHYLGRLKDQQIAYLMHGFQS